MKKLTLAILLLVSLNFLTHAQENNLITEQQATEIAKRYIMENTNSYCTQDCMIGTASFDVEKNAWVMLFNPQIHTGSYLSTTLRIYVSADGQTSHIEAI